MGKARILTGSGEEMTKRAFLVLALGLLMALGPQMLRAEQFECLGHIDGPRWLDGMTTEGKVRLAPNNSFSGTKWKLVRVRGAIGLKCLGHLEGKRWLDGNTTNGTVALVSRPDLKHSGTRWKIIYIGKDKVKIECLGTIPGPKWLDGRTANGTVGLASKTGGRYTGTIWRIHR